MKSITFIVVLFSSLFYSVNAQGVIYSKTAADSLYASVLRSTDVQNILLIKFFNQTDGTLMFRFNENGVIILNNDREQLFPGAASVSVEDVFRVFAVDLINQIIQNGENSTTSVELRSNGVISLSNGNYTLEFGQDCPPYCP